MEDKNQIIADAIVRAAHIISNNDARTPDGTLYGGLEGHSMKISEAIDGLAAAVMDMAHQIGRIADAAEGDRDA